MADIMHKTSRLMAAVLLGCLLAGCGGQLLSHREIVRAVFFTAQDAGYTVTLLTSDQQSEDSAACKTFTGSGATCAAAWNAAAQTMNGQPFYGSAVAKHRPPRAGNRRVCAGSCRADAHPGPNADLVRKLESSGRKAAAALRPANPV